MAIFNNFFRKFKFIITATLVVGFLFFGGYLTAKAFNIENDLDFGGTYGIKNTKNISIGTTTAETGKIIFSDGTSRGTYGEVGVSWSTDTEGIYYINGKVGIGVSNPISVLDVSGDVNLVGHINLISSSFQIPTGVLFTGATPIKDDLIKTAGDISSTGSFGLNTGGGFYSFPSKVSVDSLRLTARASAPSGVETGEMYFNTNEEKLYVYTGSSWNNLEITEAICEGYPTQTDDSDCGTIDCDGNNYYYQSGSDSPTGTNYCKYRDYVDLTSNRCEGVSDCKDANTNDCTSYSDSTQATAGICKYISGCTGTTAGSVSNYSSGTSCGTSQECDGSGNCVTTCFSNGTGCSSDGECCSTHCVHSVCRSSDPYCGDGYCDLGENCGNCSADCSCGAGEFCDSTQNVCSDGSNGSPCDVNSDCDSYYCYDDDDSDRYSGGGVHEECRSSSMLGSVGDDCNDSNSSIHPGVSDPCDGIDNDCDGLIDENPNITWYEDCDNDGHYVSTTKSCSDPGSCWRSSASSSGDCDDNDSRWYQVLTCYYDGDDDGYGRTGTTADFCVGSSCSTIDGGNYTADVGGDCDDSNSSKTVSPESNCSDGIDNDCDGWVDGCDSDCGGGQQCTSGICCNTSTCSFDQGNKSVGGDTIYCDSNGKMWTPTEGAGEYGGGLDWSTGYYGDQCNYSDCNSCGSSCSTCPACGYCQGLSYAGYSDWRLPSCSSGSANSSCELYVFFNETNRSWDPSASDDRYWSSTGVDSTHAKFVRPDGYINNDGKEFSNHVHCVRD